MNYGLSIGQKLQDSDYRDYTLHFKPVSNSNVSVRFIDHSLSKELTVGINLDDKDFKYRIYEKFPSVVADIVDRSAAAESLLPADMQSRLLQLYRTYVSEWNAVESHIAAGLLNKRCDQQASDRCLIAAQEG